jgi:predicted methyltransferase
MTNLPYDPNFKFVDPMKVLFAAGLSTNQTFADLGSGSGFYTLAGSKIVGDHGVVYSVDILESALDHIAAEARLKNYRNIKTILADLDQPAALKQVADGSVDLVLFANITHQVKNKENLFTNAYRMLKSGGKLLIIDWNDQPGLIGPKAADRISQDQVNQLAKNATFKTAGNMMVDPYHFGLMFIK